MEKGKTEQSAQGVRYWGTVHRLKEREKEKEKKMCVWREGRKEGREAHLQKDKETDHPTQMNRGEKKSTYRRSTEKKENLPFCKLDDPELWISCRRPPAPADVFTVLTQNTARTVEEPSSRIHSTVRGPYGLGTSEANLTTARGSGTLARGGKDVSEAKEKLV